jgi:hypothetical protein
METSIALILASVATKYVVSTELPKISYNTLCDWYILQSYLFNSSVIACNCVTYLVNKGTLEPSDPELKCAAQTHAACSYPCFVKDVVNPEAAPELASNCTSWYSKTK